jgi:hypothetical protein
VLGDDLPPKQLLPITINKVYNLSVPKSITIYRKMKMTNPSDQTKQLRIISETPAVLQARSDSITLAPRGEEYIRVKISGQGTVGPVEVKLSLVHEHTRDIEEILLFKIQTVEPTAFRQPISKNKS